MFKKVIKLVNVDGVGIYSENTLSPFNLGMLKGQVLSVASSWISRKFKNRL